MSGWLLFLTQFSILTFALLGGIFLAFSDFIMRSLKNTDGTGGADAMKAINREVFRYVFIPLFLAMVPVSLALGVGAYVALNGPAPFIAAAVIYVLGAFGVTVVCNVPMNDRLAALDGKSTEGIKYWNDEYLPRWTRWNSVRAAACIVASVLLLFAISVEASAL